MKKLLLAGFLLLVICFDSTNSFAQAADDGGKNVVKLNMSNLAFLRLGLQYERITGPKQSFAFGIGYTPNRGLPLTSTITGGLDEGDEAITAVESMSYNKITLTPEYRFYIGKSEAPKGFYIAPMLRYSRLSFENEYTYTTDAGKAHKWNVDGKLSGFGAGVLFGVQWTLGKVITLDWWIFGPYVGTMSAEINAKDNNLLDPLTDQDRADIKSNIEDVSIPLWDLSANVQTNKIAVDISGPFYGARFMGLNLGFRF